MTRPKIAFVICAFLACVAWLSVPAIAAPSSGYRQVSKNWNISAPGANTDAITDVTWPSDRACRVTIQVATGTVVNLMVTRGGQEFALGLNANTALTAGAVYVFDVHGMVKSDTVNVQVETDSAINTLSLEQVL